MWRGAGFTEQDDGAEDGILLQADAQLESTAAFCHALHQQPFYTSPRIVLADPIQDGIRRLGHLGRGAQIQHDTVDLGFMGDIRRA
ncbi:hypothetical protein D3C76_1287090 [compost metagenome]